MFSNGFNLSFDVRKFSKVIKIKYPAYNQIQV